MDVSDLIGSRLCGHSDFGRTSRFRVAVGYIAGVRLILSGNSNIGADTQDATLSITIDGNTYTVADATNGMLVINTNKGGELTINFDDSTWGYLF